MERSRAVAAVPAARVERRHLLEAKRIFILPAVGTALLVVTALPAEYLLGLGLALLLNQKGLRGARFFRVYFVLPMMLSPVAVSYDIGQMLFHEVRGPINQFLRLLGLAPVPWRSDPAVAL